MIFLLTIADDKRPEGWTEKHEFDCETTEDAVPQATAMVNKFNGTLYPGELPRRLVSVVIPPPDCDWHRGHFPIEQDNAPGCQDCGCLLATESCACCHEEFLDYSCKGGDDVVRGPYVTSSGDLKCIRCGRRQDQADEAAAEDEQPWFDPHDHT